MLHKTIWYINIGLTILAMILAITFKMYLVLFAFCIALPSQILLIHTIDIIDRYKQKKP